MRRGRRHERWGLLLLIAAALAWGGVHYHPFLVPNNDFHTFADAARRLAAGELPLDSKRLPLFPGLIALLAPLLPGPHVTLSAALVWNGLFALGTLAALHRLAARSLGEGALLVPVLTAGTAVFPVQGLQPLVEPSLTFSVVLAFVGFQARSPGLQYGAAAAVGLGRYEAALLIPVLVVVNAAADGRVLRHVGWGAAAALPLAAWRLLVAAQGPAGGSYLDLMAGMGFSPAPEFAWRVLREAFVPLSEAGPMGWLALAVVGPVLWLGLRDGLAHFRRESAALLLFAGAAVGAVVVFGVDKARYAAPVVWIPILFFAAGLVRARRLAADRLAPRLGRSAEVAGALALAGALAAGLLAMAGRPRLAPFAVEAGFALALVAAAAPALVLGGAAGRGAGLAALALVAGLVTAGAARRQTALFHVHHANHGSHLVGRFVAERLGPEERIVVLNAGAVAHAAERPIGSILTFGASRAGTLSELAGWMDDEGADWLAWTWRPPAETPSAAYYDERKNVDLAEPFADGSPVPGFEHAVRLPVPDEAGQADAQVYRRTR